MTHEKLKRLASMLAQDTLIDAAQVGDCGVLLRAFMCVCMAVVACWHGKALLACTADCNTL